MNRRIVGRLADVHLAPTAIARRTSWPKGIDDADRPDRQRRPSRSPSATGSTIPRCRRSPRATSPDRGDDAPAQLGRRHPAGRRGAPRSVRRFPELRAPRPSPTPRSAGRWRTSWRYHVMIPRPCRIRRLRPVALAGDDHHQRQRRESGGRAAPSLASRSSSHVTSSALDAASRCWSRPRADRARGVPAARRRVGPRRHAHGDPYGDGRAAGRIVDEIVARTAVGVVSAPPRPSTTAAPSTASTRVRELIAEYGHHDICDIGGGRTLWPKEVAELRSKLTLIDVSADELELAPEGHRTLCMDVTAPLDPANRERFDLIFSKFVAEHVPDGPAMPSQHIRDAAPRRPRVPPLPHALPPGVRGEPRAARCTSPTGCATP